MPVWILPHYTCWFDQGVEIYGYYPAHVCFQPCYQDSSWIRSPGLMIRSFSLTITRFSWAWQLNKLQVSIFCFYWVKAKEQLREQLCAARRALESWIIQILNHTLPPLLFPPVASSTKAPPHPSTSRAYSPTATTVSACALSDSARMLLSWVAPTAPRWPSPSSAAMRWPAALQPAWGPGPPQSPSGPGEAWPTSSAHSSSWWFLPSSLFSSLLSSSILSLNEQFVPLSCRVIALFPALCILEFSFFFLQVDTKNLLWCRWGGLSGAEC